MKIHYLLIHKVHDLVTHNQSQKEYTQNCHPKLNGHLLYKEELSFSCNKYTERSVNEGLLTQYSQVPMEQTRSVQNEYWKEFFQNRTLQMHKSMHTKIEQPLCTEYRNGFDQRQNDPKDCFIQTGGLPFVHDRCGERFYEKESLFSGTECSQRFTQKEHLTEHSRMHTKEQRFVCNVCGKRFKYRYILEHHRLMHSGERPYVCRECGKGYTSKQNLIKHTRVHTGERPFACDQCEKKFMQKEHLMGHKRTHSEERPFVCSNCGKGFARNLSLQRHCLIHSEKRLFVCDQCGKGFNRKYILERHRKQLHIKEEHVLSKTPL